MGIICECGHEDTSHPLFTWKGIEMRQCQKCLCKRYKFKEVKI